MRWAMVLLVAVGMALGTIRATSADDPTPTPPPASPVATSGVLFVTPTSGPTASVNTPEVEATDLPTVTQEQSTPVATNPPPATEAPVVLETPTATALPVPRRRYPQGTRRAAPAPTPAPVQTSPVPLEVPLPSPDELRLNARLRWGLRVPASVRRWAFLIVPAAHRYHLDPNLIAAVMTMESNGDPLAWNSLSDARGLMQVLHGPWDPRANVFRGARMLAKFLGEFGDLSLALAAYNAGPNAVLAYNGIPPYRETRDYVIVVAYLYDLFSHHRLDHRRRSQYQSTLKDLRRFADQRRKVAALARIGHVQDNLDVECRILGNGCDQSAGLSLFSTHDPFWPLGDAPDPLQRVDPSSSSP